jgi:hypothetical protein
MSAHLSDLPCVIPSTSTHEVERRHGVVGAVGVALDHRMPATTVRAHHQRIELEQDPVVVHPASIARKGDSAGLVVSEESVRRGTLHRIDHQHFDGGTAFFDLQSKLILKGRL